MYQYLKDICSVMTVVGRHLFQDHWEGLNKKFVSVQDSICYIMLRSAWKAINKNQNTILQPFILALYLFIGEGNDNSLQYSCLERIPWAEVGYSTWDHGAEHNWETNTHVYCILAVLGLRCCVGFSLVGDSRGYFLVVVRRLLAVGASLVADHRCVGLVVVALKL